MTGHRSLALRFAAAAGLIGALGAVLLVLAGRAQLRRDFEQEVLRSAAGVSAIVRASTRTGMLQNHWGDVKQVLRDIARQREVVLVRLLDKRGRVVLSTNEAEIGSVLSLSAPECRPCHEGNTPSAHAPREERVRIFRAADGSRVLGMIEPVPREKECSPCHAGTDTLLGIIDTHLSLAETDHINGTQTARLAAAALGLQILTAAGIALAIAWMLRRRLDPMLATVRRLGGGDYTARVDLATNDEFRTFGGAFNHMAGELERAHDELQNWARTLQDRVDEKTRELQTAHEQMIRSERLACLGRLAATVAHELNNPLAGVQVYARRARKALAAPADVPAARAQEIGGWMETVDREVGRCGRIVQDLLAFSRQRAPQRAPVDVNEVVRRATRLLGHKLDLEEIDLALELDARLDPVVADGGQVEQALLAVMINAVEAMPKGGVLSIATRPYAGGGAEIEVKDSGQGIPAEIMPHIFEPFFTTKSEGQGTGLGLSVVYGIVTRHGGRLDVSSAPGEGTCVTLLFPPTAPADEADDAAPAEAPQVTR